MKIHQLRNVTAQTRELPLPGRPQVPPRATFDVPENSYHEGVKALVDRGLFIMVGTIELTRKVEPEQAPIDEAPPIEQPFRRRRK